MYYDVGHPLVSLNDWQQFCRQLSPYFSHAISRDQIDLPYWLAPLARGVIVASPVLLQRTGYKKRRPPPCKWQSVRPGVYQAAVDETRLRVQRMNCGNLWMISRWPRKRDMHSNQNSETLVHKFGATPLLVRDLNEALHLAYWFEVNKPFASLQWVRVCPSVLFGALTYAMRRARNESQTISWNDSWVSAAHRRRIQSRRVRYKDYSRLPPPVIVRNALAIAARPPAP